MQNYKYTQAHVHVSANQIGGDKDALIVFILLNNGCVPLWVFVVHAHVHVQGEGQQYREKANSIVRRPTIG